jgi:hypothetical protein
MKRVKRWRFYCEHCGKSSGSGRHMSRHEKGCTTNPDRHCGMCGRQGVGGLVESLGAGDEAGVDRLRGATNGCPACMLAAIRQSGLQYPPDAESPGYRVPFDFKAAQNDWWARKNEEEMSDYRVG